MLASLFLFWRSWLTPQRALYTQFAVLGMQAGAWNARLPAIREGLAIGTDTLGLVLLGSSLGAFFSSFLSVWLVGHVGARRAAHYTGFAMLVALPLAALMPFWWLLMGLMIIYSSMTALFTDAINLIGVKLERSLARAIFTGLHGWYCVGALAGSLLGSFIAIWPLSPWLHFTLVSLAMIWPLHWAYRTLPADEAATGEIPLRRFRFFVPRGQLLLLGGVAMLAALVEGGLAGWANLYLRNDRQMSESHAALGFAVIVAAMLLARMLGDRLRERWGTQTLLIGAGIMSAIGTVWAILAPGLWLSLCGFGIAGLGVATLIPCLFRVGGRKGSGFLAVVTSFLRMGGLIQPLAMGYLAQRFGAIGWALAMLVLLALLFSVLVYHARLLRS